MQRWDIADEMVIGAGPFRDPTTEVMVDDPFLDPIHAGFLVTEDGLYLADLRSRSGTYVRFSAVERWSRIDPDHPRLLTKECEIRVGRTNLRFVP